jgi:serine/threonine-protein kinase
MIGELLGSYRIIKLLGAGAMGQVYLAEHRHLKRQAALKVLARELVDRPDLLERFFLEARATSAIAHPGIVQIFDCEIDNTGRPYIVMELLTGETLAATIARLGALAPVSAARLTRSLADALEAAHSKGIVHRDLKPENIFVQPEPPDTIKLVDFGIAKLAGEFQAQQMHKTRSGSVMGTPLYMSPEQCRDSANIDFRTDIYSLGCVFFEMLTGRPPFVRDNFGDLLVAHITEAPPDARTFAPSVPAALAELLGELLRKDPSERPASARQVAERLQTYVARMTTVPGAAAFAPGPAAAPMLASAMSSAAATAPTTAPPPAGVRTTFGASASEVGGSETETLERPPRRKGPLLAALLVAAGGAVAAALALRPSPAEPPPAPPPVAVTPAPPAPVAPKAPSAPAEPKAPAPAAPKPAPAVHEAVATPPPASKPSKPTRTVAATAPSRREPAPPPSAPPPPAAVVAPPPAAEERRGATPHAGAWEGPWVDAANNQRGRLFLQVAPGGSVAGWMYNTSAKLSFRMSGTMKRDGAVDLDCQCPADQAFSARGAFAADEDGDLKGDIALSASSRVFGHARVTLRRNASPTAPPR